MFALHPAAEIPVKTNVFHPRMLFPFFPRFILSSNADDVCIIYILRAHRHSRHHTHIVYVSVSGVVDRTAGGGGREGKDRIYICT